MKFAPEDSRYVPLTQQKWLCVPTCIQMVMYRRGLPLMPAEVLGHELGLLVPEKDRRLFWKAETGEMPRAGWGTRIYLPEYGLDAALERLGVPLRVELELIDGFEDAEAVRGYLERAERDDADVLVCFDYGTLHDTEYHGGHVNVFDRLEGDEVRLVDPESTVPKWRTVKLEKLFAAMKAHGPEKSGGFWRMRGSDLPR